MQTLSLKGNENSWKHTQRERHRYEAQKRKGRQEAGRQGGIKKGEQKMFTYHLCKKKERELGWTDGNVSLKNRVSRGMCEQSNFNFGLWVHGTRKTATCIFPLSHEPIPLWLLDNLFVKFEIQIFRSISFQSPQLRLAHTYLQKQI